MSSTHGNQIWQKAILVMSWGFESLTLPLSGPLAKLW